MTTGLSLFLIATLFSVGFALYKIHQKKKWRLMLKISAIIILLIAVVVSLIYGYFWYINRPHVVDTLGNISLNMTPVDVTLALGKPSLDVSFEGEKRYVYKNSYGDLEYFIRFNENRATLICSHNYVDNFFGLGKYDSEQGVIDKLGLPSNVSINKNGLSKFISYEKYKIAFEITKRSVETLCVTDSGVVNFAEEYDQNQPLSS